MDAKICDRCGEYFAVKHRDRMFLLRKIKLSYIGWSEDIDLCPDCQNAFNDWMEKKEEE